MEKRYEIIDRIIELEIYLYIIFMFLTKGEGIRNVLLFSGFFLWLITLKYRKNKDILKEPIAIFFWIFIGTILLSVIFSIDPLYSFKRLRDEPLKAVILFCLISTTLSNEVRLKRFVYLTFPILIFTISVGYYSYFAYDLPLMKPVTAIRHAWHTRFALDIDTLLPFVLILLILHKDTTIRIVIVMTVICSILALIMSTSKGGIANFLSMLIVLSVYLCVRSKKNVTLILTGLVIFMVVLGGLFYGLYPKDKMVNLQKDITTLTRRTEIWGPLISAAYNKPVFGWGYGSRIFKIDKPFEHTPYKVAPINKDTDFRNPHNPFLRIFFHQGIVGLIPYIILHVIALTTFWKGALSSRNLRSYILIACASILIGSYLVNAVVENSELTDLTFSLGIGLAAVNSGREKGLPHIINNSS